MLYMMKHKVTGEIKTLWKKDAARVKKFSNFELIQDQDEIKAILDDKYTSKHRGEGYDKNLPSVTVITNSLYPVDFYKEHNLIAWLDRQDTEGHKDHKQVQNVAFGKGTDLHAVLENYLKDNGKICNVSFKKYTDNKNFLNCLERFHIDERNIFECEHSEIFLKTPYIQGTIDCLGYYEDVPALIDFKTTSSKWGFASKDKLIPYYRQLCMYSMMLEECGIMTRRELEKLRYIIFQWHLVKEDYRRFEIEQENIFACKTNILKVLNWYHKVRETQIDD